MEEVKSLVELLSKEELFKLYSEAIQEIEELRWEIAQLRQSK